MLEYPEVLAKAQQEIDEVIGHNRTPELEDWEKLPYIRAIVNEVCAIMQRNVHIIHELSDSRYIVTVHQYQQRFHMQQQLIRW